MLLIAPDGSVKHIEASCLALFCIVLRYALEMANQPKVSEFDKMLMRFPPGMRDRLAEKAKESGRSINAEVVARLEKSLEADSDLDLMKQMIAEHEDRLEAVEKTLKRMGVNMDILAERAGVQSGDR